MQSILSWSGLEYNEGPDKLGTIGPYTQSQRLKLYQSYAQRLLDVSCRMNLALISMLISSSLQSNQAYRDFQSEEDQRVSTGEERGPLRPDEEQELLRSGKSYTVRLRMPKTTAQVQDLVYGKLTFPFDEAVGDPVLMKSDGWPTYHLASVVDDHTMGITHVLRGEVSMLLFY
jgi:glutamyl-tRNA synthetase